MDGGMRDYDAARKVQYLNHVFRLPWDSRVDTSGTLPIKGDFEEE